MARGYGRALYLLPFDHRHSYLTDMFGMSPPLTAQQTAAVIESKRVIYDGFRLALSDDRLLDAGGVLVDEEYGSEILTDARTKGYITVLPVEASGAAEFTFAYGEAFRRHIDAFDPTFVKALVRYNPGGGRALNERQLLQLRRLSDHCASAGRRLMLELLVPATPEQLARAHHDDAIYDVWTRPTLMLEAIHALQDGGVEPDVWKVEGLDRRDDCERIVAAARRGGRTDVGCIVLGAAAPVARVERWLETAATVPGYIGFAVGRTTYRDAMVHYLAKRITRREAASRIALNFRKWSGVFQSARQFRPSAA
jgi:myo-inositol catabolism protein IolC